MQLKTSKVKLHNFNGL